MQAYLSKSGREIWHVDYFNWIVSPDQSRDQSLFISFSQMVFFMQAEYKYLCFYLSLPLFYVTFLWGESFSSSFPCEIIYCKSFLQPGCYPYKMSVLQKKRSVHCSLEYIAYWFYLFIRGILGMDLHMIFFCLNTWCRWIWREKKLMLS